MIPVELAVGGNEASDLLPVRSPAVLDAYGWRRAFWTVLDEGPVEHSIALLGQRHPAGAAPIGDTAPAGGAGRWDAHLLAAEVGAQAGRTEDAEALAFRDGHVYVIGSHFGSKRGPLRPRRAFVARFREADAALTRPVHLDVVRNEFRLHRALNDALAAAHIRVLSPGQRVRHGFIEATRDRGSRKGRPWVELIADGDLPVNLEAAVFTGHGTLLLGLRYPVSADGKPLLVELADVDSLFDADGTSLPTVAAVHTLPGAGVDGALVGFRALSARSDGGYDAVVGSIDALGKGSAVLDDHPHGSDVTCRHVRFTLPDPRAIPVADLAPFHNVEGVATVDGETFYVTDEDHRVALWVS